MSEESEVAKVEENMEKALQSTLVATSTRVTGKMIRDTATASSPGMTVRNMKDSGRMIESHGER